MASSGATIRSPAWSSASKARIWAPTSSATTRARSAGGDDVYTNKIDTIASVVGRFGWAFDNWLFYSKAGWAGAHAKFSVVDNIPPTGAGSTSNWHNGFTVGSGVDYAFTPNWIVGFETNYYRFESKTYELGGGAGLYTFNSRPKDVYTFLGRLSYKFGWGAY